MVRKRANNILQCPEPFIMIPNELIVSERFNSLSSSSIRLYLVLLTKWSRDKSKVRNKFIFEYRELKRITGLSNQTISNSLKELEQKSFIDITYGGKNNPSKYEITYKDLTK